MALNVNANTVAPILQIRNIYKSFSGTKALDDVSVDIYPGEIHALLGENGAGKSTLIKILCGVYTCTNGKFIYKGQDIGNDISQLSISVVHQDLGLVDEMSVMENIAQVTGYKKNSSLISWKQTKMQAMEVLSKMDCDINPDALVSSLSAAEKSMVAISRALINKTDILILDEPTATLPQKDVDKLFDKIRQLKNQGIAIIYVSHRLDEIFEIAQKITVLRSGKLIKTTDVGNITPEQLVYDLIGRNVETVRSDRNSLKQGESIMELRDVNTSFVGPVNFTLHRGEILALFGLRGAGHHEVGRCIWGVEPKDSGKVFVNGVETKIKSPSDAINKKIGFVSSKRKEEGMAEVLSVRENLYANPYAYNHGKFSLLDIKKERENAVNAIKRFTVKTSDEETAIGTLSGGNQQKVMVARWFEADSDILIFEEPTIGVDIGAKMDIYAFMQELLAKGKAVLLISSDVEEVCNIAHRVLIFDRGGVLGEVTGDRIQRTYLNGVATGAFSLDKVNGGNEIEEE